MSVRVPDPPDDVVEWLCQLSDPSSDVRSNAIAHLLPGTWTWLEALIWEVSDYAEKTWTTPTQKNLHDAAEISKKLREWFEDKSTDPEYPSPFHFCAKGAPMRSLRSYLYKTVRTLLREDRPKNLKDQFADGQSAVRGPCARALTRFESGRKLPQWLSQTEAAEQLSQPEFEIVVRTLASAFEPLPPLSSAPLPTAELSLQLGVSKSVLDELVLAAQAEEKTTDAWLRPILTKWPIERSRYERIFQELRRHGSVQPATIAREVGVEGALVTAIVRAAEQSLPPGSQSSFGPERLDDMIDVADTVRPGMDLTNEVATAREEWIRALEAAAHRIARDASPKATKENPPLTRKAMMLLYVAHISAADDSRLGGASELADLLAEVGSEETLDHAPDDRATISNRPSSNKTAIDHARLKAWLDATANLERGDWAGKTSQDRYQGRKEVFRTIRNDNKLKRVGRELLESLVADAKLQHAVKVVHQRRDERA